MVNFEKFGTLGISGRSILRFWEMMASLGNFETLKKWGDGEFWEIRDARDFGTLDFEILGNDGVTWKFRNAQKMG